MPSSIELVNAFTLAVHDGVADADADQPLAIACKLCRAHGNQWDAEDESRVAVGDCERLAAVKQKIDVMNMQRSRLIEALDDCAMRNLSQAKHGPLHTETLGSVIDRLSIAWIRTQKLNHVGSRRKLASRQLHELALAYDTLLAEVIAGRRRVPDWRLLKSYGEV